MSLQALIRIKSYSSTTKNLSYSHVDGKGLHSSISVEVKFMNSKNTSPYRMKQVQKMVSNFHCLKRNRSGTWVVEEYHVLDYKRLGLCYALLIWVLGLMVAIHGYLNSRIQSSCTERYWNDNRACYKFKFHLDLQNTSNLLRNFW